MSLPEVSTPAAEIQPVTAPPAKGLPRERIEYLTAFRYVFTHPEWFKNLLIVAAFTLIPVLNTALLFGYLFEITEHLYRRLPGPYPLFQVRRFALYVTRGIWCYVVVQMVAVIVAPVAQVLIQGTTFGSMAVMKADERTGIIILAIVVPLVVTGFFLFLLTLMLVLTPLYMRGGLTQDFALTFKFRWIGDYLRKMWVETLFVNVFMLLSMLVLVPLGCVLFCYGALVASAMTTLASANLNWQLYELYLARGGEPIPLKEEVQGSKFDSSNPEPKA